MKATRVPRGLRLLVMGIIGLVVSIGLAACGGGGVSEGTDNSDIKTAPFGKASGALNISNWQAYIDEKTVPEFEQATGLTVQYNEDVNSNEEFFGEVQPLLSRGESGERSLLMVTDWMSKRMYDLGYLQKLDPEGLKTVFANMLPSLKDPAFDPGRAYSIPWQSGMTGLVVNTKEAPGIKSINDLFDSKYKGRVVMLNELRDTVPLVMKADGVDPETADTQDWLDTIEKIREARDSGQIRAFTGNNYLQIMASGNAAAAIGWSGDAPQIKNPDVEYVSPEQGCMLWSDNMSIPVGAPNPEGAYEFMNYVYEPENQAQIVEYVNYISPVKGVKEILLKKDPDLANNELIFPPEEWLNKCTPQLSPPGNEEQVKEVENAWASVVSG